MSAPRDPARRRRLAVLVVVGLASALAEAVAGSGSGGDPREPGPASRGASGGSMEAAPAPRTDPAVPRPAPRPRSAPVDRLSLRQQVGQLLIFSLPGFDLPGYAREILRERRAAGVILFGENVSSPGQVRDLTRSIQRAAGGGALICTDQEGGQIRILPFAPPSAGQPSLSSSREAAETARATARGLRRVGVNVALAPVADVAAGRGSAVDGRAYPGGATQVARSTRAAVRGFRAGRVAPTVKHFPGFGAASANTDDRPVTIDSSRKELARNDLPPFRAAVAAKAPLVMAAHALYPALDPDRIASQSPAVLDRLLRRELGYDGVIVTDSIEAKAVLRRSSVEMAAVRSLKAGADLVLMTGPGSYPDVYRTLTREAKRSRAFRARVRASAARVLALKRDLGLRNG